MEEYVPRRFVYGGRRLAGNNSAFVVFYSEENPTETATFTNPKTIRRFKSAIIGGIYEHQVSGESFRLSDTYLARSLLFNDQLAEWKLLDDVVDATIKAKNSVKNRTDAASEEVERALAPLKRAYNKTDSTGKLVIEALLLRLLRR